MEIPLEVSLTEGSVSVDPFPFSRFPPGTNVILKITGAALREIKLVVGDPTPSVKLTLLDQNGDELDWPDGTKGANIEPPPPPPVSITM